MARDKAKDDLYFNCSQDHEAEYVSGLYGKNKDEVKEFLADKCKSGDIFHSTHKAVYELIKKELGYPIPVAV